MWMNSLKNKNWKQVCNIFILGCVVLPILVSIMRITSNNKVESKSKAEFLEKVAGISALSITQCYLEHNDASFNTIEDYTYIDGLLQKGNKFISNENKDDFIKLAKYIKENNEKEVRKLFNALLPKYVDEKNKNKFNELDTLAMDEKVSQEEYDNKLNELAKKQISN